MRKKGFRPGRFLGTSPHLVLIRSAWPTSQIRLFSLPHDRFLQRPAVVCILTKPVGVLSSLARFKRICHRGGGVSVVSTPEDLFKFSRSPGRICMLRTFCVQSRRLFLVSRPCSCKFHPLIPSRLSYPKSGYWPAVEQSPQISQNVCVLDITPIHSFARSKI